MKMAFGRTTNLLFCRSFLDRRFKKNHHLRIQEAVPLSKDKSDLDNDWLTKPAFEEEVLHAVFQISPIKAHGPNCIQAFSFQKYWNILGKNIIYVVQNFLSSGFLLKSLNRTNISLILKRKNLDKVKL